jgi:hypothetical protein
MGKCKCIIGSRSFDSKKDATEYVRTLLNTIGLCSSVKSKGDHLFNELHEVLQRHPKAATKLNGIVDMKIVMNMHLTGKEVHIVKSNGNIEDISWLQCVSGKAHTPQSELLSAMRYSVENQIRTYKENANCVCMECKQSTLEQPHVDHVIHFAKLVKDFHRTTRLNPPTTFATASDHSNRRDFRSEDKAYMDAWIDYHQKNAILRILCKTCNLTREKYKS